MDDAIVRLIGPKLEVYVKGELDIQGLTTLKAQIDLKRSACEQIEWQLDECDIEDPIALIECINLIREQLRTGVLVTLVHAPQLLAHDLYRVGQLLPGSRLTLRDPRQEIGTA